MPPNTRIRLRTTATALALAALTLSPAAADRPGTVLLGVDPSFAPMLGRRSVGTVLQRVRHPTSEEIRWADTEPSITAEVDLGDGGRLLRLDRFGRKANQEIGGSLRSVNELVLDLRHNQGGVLRRMLHVAARFTGPVPGAVRLINTDRVRMLAIPRPRTPVWRGRITVLVGANTISSGEVLAALLRRHAGATVLGERTWGKDYVLRVEPIDHDWRALIPDGRIEVPGEILAGGLVPDGPISDQLAADLPTD